MVTKHLIANIVLTICALHAWSQPKLVFTPDTWDFGTIRESDGKVSCTFVGENRGDRPAVVIRVVSSCGCTIPSFSREPVMPGQQLQIRVTFDPTDRPGAFDKTLGVYTADRQKCASLTIRGHVIGREKRVEELYPVDAGALRLTSTIAAFAYLPHGRMIRAAIGFANVSDREATIALAPELESGFLQYDAPERIAPGARGEIELRYFIPSESSHYGSVNDRFALSVNGRRSPVTLTAYGIVVDDFDAGGEDFGTPKAQTDKNMLKFEALKRSGGRRSRTFVLKNTGDAPLIVRAVECGDALVCSLRPGMQIAPGEAAEATVSLDPSGQEYGILMSHLSIVTNDPEHPMRRMRVTAMIEE